jgi:DNA-binding CsgD family transcriptional regulator
MDMVAKFAIAIARDAGYTKPVYLQVEGFAGRETITPNPVPDGVNTATLDFDMGGLGPIKVPFAVGGYEDDPEA